MMESGKKGLDVLLIGYEDEENLGLRYIAAFLNENGVKTGLEPYDPSDKEGILDRILLEKPDLVGFSLIFQRMLPDFADLIGYLRSHQVEAHFTMGGHFPTIEFRETLNHIPQLDSVVRHEGEETVLELYKNLEKPENWQQIKGLAYLDNKGNLQVTPTRPLIKDLDSLPYPLRDLKMNSYRGLGVCSIIASRGCYYNCSFCSVKEFYSSTPGRHKRTRSASNVIGEMQELFEKGVRIFNFKDDDLGTRSKAERIWVNDFAKGLKETGLADEIIWRISCRVDQVESDIIGELKQAGLKFLYLGIESGSKQGLKTLNKHYTVNDIYRTLDTLEKVNMEFEYGFMLFEPSSSMETIKENINFLENLCKEGRAIIHFTKMAPYAGTPIALKLKKEGLLKGEVSYPDYSYKDRRMELLEFFLGKAFHKCFFDSKGIVNTLQGAKFDAIVLENFFPDKYDTKYLQSVKNLNKRFNASAAETMNKAVDFMEDKDYEEILHYWNILNVLLIQELEVQEDIKAEIDKLMLKYH